MTFLPLHAAGKYNELGHESRLYNYVVSSYTPTLSALLLASKSSPPKFGRLLAVSQPAGLPGTLREIANIKQHVESDMLVWLNGQQASAEEVLRHMNECDWIHFACHAVQDASDPTKSSFILHNGNLELATIMRRSFEHTDSFAFLSACQTATGDEKLPEEAVHLAAGMLMAGYRSVIATMWAIKDDDAPLIADGVYAHLMKPHTAVEGGEHAAHALHHAVARLREKVGEREFARWVPFIHLGR